jgi:outer membrane protein assembly factor BamB
MRNVSVVLLLVASIVGAEDWDRFRGPNGSGVSASTGFPTEFGKQKNLLWRTPVRQGKSSPVLTRRHIFLTGFEDGKLYMQCFDRETGTLLWERAVNRARTESVNALNHPAAITPVADGENLYAFFYEYGLVSYSPRGELRWEVKLGPFSNSMGHSSCPILAGGNVILVLDQMVDSYIAAFDQGSGEIRWRTSREEMEGWATPLLYHPSGTVPVVVTASRGQLGAHRATDGKRLWSRSNLAPSVVASPILDKDTLYTFGYGYDAVSPFVAQLEEYDKNHDGKLSPDEYGNNAYLVGIGRFGGNKNGIVTQEKWEARQRLSMAPSSLLSIRLQPGATTAGDGQLLTKELWRYEKSFVGVVPSPLLYDGVLYLVKNGGILATFDAETGEVTKTGRLTGALGSYSASPVAAEGKVFLASEEGKVAVLKASRDWEVAAINDLGESCFATPALAGGHIYLRTSEALYCFGSSAAGKLPTN